ncbi:bifunctional proline dehydrogenase/L-glutamate gamma-semialdehyde dehydrogenase [Agromyces aerolatus]|uniref:bifunctional proline dehydrogenase/L-glutamate gamma-semialdehyde dehydrogenase n=1 Tax=Agromyces sp. LY-1074 TaxID=3074080 RepID=UPI0028628710|nr:MULTISPECIES: bifunctional proline dehydrogenase/L-glutamate gamma-semialdehyde dehydrogenase [unclassified Agromyces]MDR5701551.1 bifunctional proline dehydrogenase/L-glutamate gamma-semialdehyde dehydrogenase [Agromyces sp. LY-1074]MDR5707842.1 bifunctional proline dehydrogenase/L-glutamate gamma-semialdehyde dehydrogenase [Agromyces sp. LY-1358]
MTNVSADPTASTDQVTALVRRWLAESADFPVEPAAERLAGVLKDPNGLAFTVGFVDGVMRPEDLGVAGRNLAEVARLTPAFLPWYLRAAVRIGGAVAPALPWVVIPIARRVLRDMVGHLVLDATPAKLGPAIAKLRESGNRLNLNLLGEAVLGEQEADRRLEGTYEFLARDDVDYVSIKVSSVVSQLSMWSFDEAVEKVVEKLTPLYRLAVNSEAKGKRKFINLDMEEYRDLDLTIAVFQRLLDEPQFRELEAGIVLQTYLPDALGAMQRLTEWAQARRAAGGAAIKVRVVKGANLAMEHVDARIHGWPVATYPTKQDSDTNYKRVLHWSMTPERTHAVKLGIAGHNLFDIAHAWLTAKERGIDDRVEFEMLLGMATGQAEAVRRDVGDLLLYTPVVNPAEFDVAIAYLIRRLEENASDENFMSAVFELASNPGLFDRELLRYQRSLETLAADDVPAPNRTQNRRTEWDGDRLAVELAHRDAPAPAAGDVDAESLTSVVLGFTRGSSAGDGADASAGASGSPEASEPTGPGVTPGFRNEADTDPALAANREWGRRILARVPDSELGVEAIREARIEQRDELETLLAKVSERGREWGERPAAERAALLHRAGLALAANRDRLIEVMAAETGKTIAEADPEVSEAIDFAHYYAERARELDHVQGATFVPAKLTVVTPPWNFPVAIPAGGVLAALAAGSGVVIKPAALAQRSGAVMVEALWEAGIPRDLLALVDLGERELGRELISSPLVDRVILTGAYETAELFRSFREDLPLLAETSGKNAIIVTPSADLDLAAADLAKSAFGHAGQKCSAASIAILVGSVAKSERFHRQLVDAVSSMRVGWPEDPATQIGPIVEPAHGKLRHALTQLGADEQWLVEPRQLDDTGRLWSPGVRTGVKGGSYFHLTEFFGPVLGIMHARNLDEAVALQNAVDYGLTAGLHSLDADELAFWLDRVEAGNLYVNRGITGAIVQRQPFGGWKKSSVGAGAKAGGPNYLFGLGDWVPEHSRTSNSLHLRGLDRRVGELIEASQSSLDYEQFELLRRSALSDAVAWAEEYGTVKDVSGLGVERNVFRYRPVAVTVRISDDTPLGDALRVLAAAVLSKAPFTVSTAVQLPRGVRALLATRDAAVVNEADAEWLVRVGSGGLTTSRVRLVGGDASALASALSGTPDVAVWSHAVTPSGRVELLPFLREQAVSITNHRFGNPTTLSQGVI